MIFKETSIIGAYLITPRKFLDDRGAFIKTFHADIYTEHGLEVNFSEEYYSTSNKHVLRGMHFQLPPHEHVKLVYCIVGEVLDVLLDLRTDSPTYGKVFATHLNSDNADIIYVPKGIAHGFMALSDNATLIYKTSTVHSPESDSGILWNSFNFNWPFTPASLSERDKKFTSFSNFNSPFKLVQE
jgi:dTDP-4-dehydrorhamnose 3,5-epimerase